MALDLPDISSIKGTPGLGVASAAVENLQASLNVAPIHKEQCKSLCANASTFLITLNDQIKRELHDAAVSDAAREIELVCNSAHKCIQEWRILNKVNIFLDRDEIRADLEKLEKSLELVAQNFSTTTQVEIVREQEFQRRFAESQTRDMEQLKDMFRTIIRDPTSLKEIPNLRATEVQSIMAFVQEALQNERARAARSPESIQAEMEFERGLLQIKKHADTIPALADLTGGIKTSDDVPSDSGMTADIRLGEWLGTKVALKPLRNIGAMNEEAKTNLLREIDILRKLDHRHVLRIHGMCCFTLVYLVSAHAVNENALKYLELNPEADRLRLLAGAASGLAYLHTRHPPIIHGDFRAVNILIMEQGRACISDYGLAPLEDAARNTTSTSLDPSGACRWMAPELILSVEAKRTTATDAWSFGMAALEVFTGRRPYDHCEMDAHVIQDIERQFRHPRPPRAIEKGLSDGVWSEMRRCWDRDPVKRPDMSPLAIFLWGIAIHRTGHTREQPATLPLLTSDAKVSPTFPVATSETKVPLLGSKLGKARRTVGARLNQTSQILRSLEKPEKEPGRGGLGYHPGALRKPTSVLKASPVQRSSGFSNPGKMYLGSNIHWSSKLPYSGLFSHPPKSIPKPAKPDTTDSSDDDPLVLSRNSTPMAPTASSELPYSGRFSRPPKSLPEPAKPDTSDSSDDDPLVLSGNIIPMAPTASLQLASSRLHPSSKLPYPGLSSHPPKSLPKPAKPDTADRSDDPPLVLLRNITPMAPTASSKLPYSGLFPHPPKSLPKPPKLDTSDSRNNDLLVLSGNTTPMAPIASLQSAPSRRETEGGFHSGLASPMSASGNLVHEVNEDRGWPLDGTFEVHLSTDGKSVETATLDGVIRLLALSSNSAFRQTRQTFFQVYPVFADDETVFESLCEQYRLAGLPDVSGQRIEIRSNILDLMNEWTEVQPSVLDNGLVVNRMRTFVSSTTQPDIRTGVVKYSLERKLSTSITNHVLRAQIDWTPRPPSARGLKWSKLTPFEIATQLTAIEGQFFQDITPVDCLAYFRSSMDTGGHRLEEFRDNNTRLSNWIQVILLKCPTVEMRSDVYKHFVRIASICRIMGNFSSMNAIVVALKAAAIERLEETKRKVPEHIHKELQENTALFDHNNRAYHRILETCKGLVIPILHIHLHDIKYSNSSMPVSVEGSSGQTLINFKSYTERLHHINALLRYQGASFAFSGNSLHKECIRGQLLSGDVKPNPSLNLWIERKSKEAAEEGRKTLFSFSDDTGWVREEVTTSPSNPITLKKPIPNIGSSDPSRQSSDSWPSCVLTGKSSFTNSLEPAVAPTELLTSAPLLLPYTPESNPYSITKPISPSPSPSSTTDPLPWWPLLTFSAGEAEKFPTPAMLTSLAKQQSNKDTGSSAPPSVSLHSRPLSKAMEVLRDDPLRSDPPNSAIPSTQLLNPVSPLLPFTQKSSPRLPPDLRRPPPLPTNSVSQPGSAPSPTARITLPTIQKFIQAPGSGAPPKASPPSRPFSVAASEVRREPSRPDPTDSAGPPRQLPSSASFPLPQSPRPDPCPPPDSCPPPPPPTTSLGPPRSGSSDSQLHTRPYISQHPDLIQELVSIESNATPSTQYIVDLVLAIGRAVPKAIRNKHQLYRLCTRSRDICNHLNRMAHAGSDSSSGFDNMERCWEIMDGLERTLLELTSIVTEEIVPFGVASLATWKDSCTRLSRIYNELAAPPFNIVGPGFALHATWDRYFDDCSWSSLILLEGIETPVQMMYPEEEGILGEVKSVTEALKYLADGMKLNGNIDEGSREHVITIISETASMTMKGTKNASLGFWTAVAGALRDIDTEKQLDQDILDSLRHSWSGLYIKPRSITRSPTPSTFQNPTPMSFPEDLTRLEHEITPATESLILLLRALGKEAPRATRNKHKVYAIIVRARNMCNHILSIGTRPEFNGLEDLDMYYNMIDALEGVLLHLARLLPTEQVTFGPKMCASWSKNWKDLVEILDRLHEPPFDLDLPGSKQEYAINTAFDACYWFSLLLHEGIEKELGRRHSIYAQPPVVVSVREGLRYLGNEIKYSSCDDATRELVIDIATRLYETLSASKDSETYMVEEPLFFGLSESFTNLDLNSSLRPSDVQSLRANWRKISRYLPPRD